MRVMALRCAAAPLAQWPNPPVRSGWPGVEAVLTGSGATAEHGWPYVRFARAIICRANRLPQMPAREPRPQTLSDFEEAAPFVETIRPTHCNTV